MSSQCAIALLVYRKSGKTNSNNPKSITLLRHLVYQDCVENAFAYCAPRRFQRALSRHTTHASGFGVNFSDQENVPPHTYTLRHAETRKGKSYRCRPSRDMHSHTCVCTFHCYNLRLAHPFACSLLVCFYEHGTACPVDG